MQLLEILKRKRNLSFVKKKVNSVIQKIITKILTFIRVILMNKKKEEVMQKYTIELLKSKGKWYWRIKAANRKILAHSEKYNRKCDAYRVASNLSCNLICSKFVEVANGKV